MRKSILSTTLIFIISIFMFQGCSSNDKPNLNLSLTDINSVEVYSFIVPTEVEKKIITNKEDINYILKQLIGLKMKKSYDYPPNSSVVGGSNISFRFNKNDGTSTDVIYIGDTKETGILKSSYVYYYKTEGNLNELWENLNYEVIKTNSNELPRYEQ